MCVYFHVISLFSYQLSKTTATLNLTYARTTIEYRRGIYAVKIIDHVSWFKDLNLLYFQPGPKKKTILEEVEKEKTLRHRRNEGKMFYLFHFMLP